MKKSISLVTTAVALSCGFSGGQPVRAAEDSYKAISLLPKMGDLNHPVSTTNEMAQRFFNQGLTFVFAFNHDAAGRSFKRALEYDPNLAMAQWGIGLSLGPNINMPVKPDAEKAAYEATQKAVAMLGNASDAEKDYINALAKRYSIEPDADLKKLDLEFKEAMRALKDKYSDDLDAAALYAESMMDLKPWQLWTPDGKPAEGTMEIIEVLESIMKRDPMHPGANHYYIHAVEASPWPERALPSAERLESWAPAAGHLVHMPAHVYIRTGDYAAAARRNEVASEADLDFIELCGVQGLYPALYTSHNMHFAAVAHTLQGRYASGRRYAERLLTHVKPIAEKAPELEGFLPTLEQVLVAFAKWNEILALPEPAENFKLHRGIWHYARGMAFAAQNKPKESEAEATAIAEIRKALPENATFGPFNKASDIMTIAENQVRARNALVQGDTKTARQLLEQTLPIEDQLRYMEPPDWYLSTREALGGVLLTAGLYNEAEKVFRDDLQRAHRKGRSLYGLCKSLEKQNNKSAQFVRRGFEKSWENADSAMTPELIWWMPAKDKLASKTN
jgi:tetratricopeptide (TPR) repeat protein